MKREMYLFVVVLIGLTLVPFKSYAEQPRLSEECMKKMELRNEKYNRLVMKDIIAGFNLDIDEVNYRKVTREGLETAYMIYGGKLRDDYYNSLKEYFNVASRGNPMLFVRPQEAYLLYKQLNNTNVMIHLKLNGSKWVEINRDKKSGNYIEFQKLKCETKYMKEKQKILN
ncbi:hypothetical protein ACSVDE_09145 [Pseudalkalibacillus sp. Hm43]|uniref:hypothetical protein n=1 Tax=Pseudalkalibacillus sp. Hm43 TaxID=3450742 RepID=UPI003F41FFF9